MATDNDTNLLLAQVRDGNAAMAALAVNEEVFRAAVDAFRAQDGESMHALLQHHGLGDHCELICHWLRSKESVFLCLELAGPPPIRLNEAPDLHAFAEVVAKVSADEELVELIADALQDRNVDAWKELISSQGLERFSHLLCHWAARVHYRLVCNVVCQPIQIARPHLIPELQAAGQSIGRLAADRELFERAIKQVLSNNCGGLGSTLEAGGFAPFCFLLCEWFLQLALPAGLSAAVPDLSVAARRVSDRGNA